MGLFITQHGVKIYISKYPLDVLKCEKCGNILSERKGIALFEESVIKMILLETLFGEFCQYLDGKLYWTKSKSKEWTDIALSFFREKNKTETIPYVEEQEHMKIDYIWRYDPKRYSINDIELAVEHEGEENDVATLVNKEIQHLVDLKARNKIAIFYPRMGDEKDLIEEIQRKIKSQSDIMKISQEKYLIILGYSTTKKAKRAILFKGFIFNQNGDLEKQMEQAIFQRYNQTSPK
jgi:hypothetical protein